MSTRVIEWRGPAPYYFAPLDDGAVDVVREELAALSYGWGCFHAEVTLLPGTAEADDVAPDDDAPGDGAAGVGEPVTWRTALMPHDGGFVIPLKNAIRKPAGLSAGDAVDLVLHVPNP